MQRAILIFISFSFFVTSTSIASMYAPTSLEKMVNTSTTIVKAEIVSVNAEWNYEKNKIFTNVQVEIIEFYKGESFPPVIDIVQLGGRVGEDALEIEGNPEFKKGQEVILFLVFHQNRWWINSMALGKYDIIDTNDEAVISNNLINTDILITELETKTNKKEINFLLKDFVEEIKKYIKD